MAILGFVIGALVTTFTSGANAEAQLNFRFQSQIEARVALDTLRKDIHNACSATVTGGTKVTLLVINTAKTSRPCETTSVSWCTSGSGTQYGLYRSLGSPSCSSGNQRRANYLTGGSVFSVVTTTTDELPKVGVAMTINTRPAEPRFKYVIDDEIALRNARRT
jgi:hypothetical protein